MVTEIQYTSISRVLDDLIDHPLLRNITLEQVIRHTLRFISLHGYPRLYKDQIAEIEIKGHKGLLPCDLISIIQVKDKCTDTCLRAMTDTFTPGMNPEPQRESRNREYPDNAIPSRGEYLPPIRECKEEKTFKTQGRILYTSFLEGKVEVTYKAIPTDDSGFPLLIDNETYLNALEAYIKMKVLTVMYDTGKIQSGVLSNAQTEYAWAARQVEMEFTMPSMSEMESISRYLNTMIKPVTHFDTGFKNLGDREYRRRY